MAKSVGTCTIPHAETVATYLAMKLIIDAVRMPTMLKRFTMAPEKKNMGMPERLEMSRETPNTEPVPPSSRSRLYAKFSITPLDSPIANTIEKNTCPHDRGDNDVAREAKECSLTAHAT